MKSIYSLLISFLVCITTFVSCKNSSDNQSNIAKAIGSADTNIRADKALYGLLGPVQTVTYSEDYSLNFDRAGNIVGGYSERTRYNKRSRTDELYDMTTETSTFDELGRVIHQLGSEYEQAFIYEEDFYYPSSMTGKYYETGDDEPSKITHTYSYTPKDFDQFGNWISRMDNQEKVTRTITYWPDPYDIGTQPHYKTPKAVAKAIYKAPKNEDVKTYLGTYEYSKRRLADMTVENMTTTIVGKKDEFAVRTFRIVKDVAVNEKEHEVIVDVLCKSGDIRHMHLFVYKGDDGYWYNSGLGFESKE